MERGSDSISSQFIDATAHQQALDYAQDPASILSVFIGFN